MSSSPPASRRRAMARSYVEIEVCIDEFGDDALIEEIRRRNLQNQVLFGESETNADNFSSPVTLRQVLSDIQNHLICRRYEAAKTDMQKLLEKLAPPYIFIAHEQILRGRYYDAICMLDYAIDPSPAAEVKRLPLKESTP